MYTCVSRISNLYKILNIKRKIIKYEISYNYKLCKCNIKERNLKNCKI